MKPPFLCAQGHPVVVSTEETRTRFYEQDSPELLNASDQTWMNEYWLEDERESCTEISVMVVCTHGCPVLGDVVKAASNHARKQLGLEDDDDHAGGVPDAATAG